MRELMRDDMLELPNFLIVRKDKMRIARASEHAARESKLAGLRIEMGDVLVVLIVVLEQEDRESGEHEICGNSLKINQDPLASVE